MSEQASSWLTAVEGLPQVHDRLKRVVVLRRPCVAVIRQHDEVSTLFYLDPPYPADTRATDGVYAFDMSETDHCELLDAARAAKGIVVLSGYHCDLYDRELRDWRCHEFDLPNNSAGGDIKRRMTECVWINRP